MNILNDNIRKIYVRYLLAAFGSTLISSIYTSVDMAVVGHSQGASGTAALAVVAPVWNVIFSLGLLSGIGGSVLFSVRRGRGSGRENEYFTASFIFSAILALVTWAGLVGYEREILTFCGADDVLMALAMDYMRPIKAITPAFIFGQTLTAFLRNDNDPMLATWSVIAGGIFNVFGDIYFVFGLDMGIFGAGLATAIGAMITFVTLLVHFVRSSNTLKFSLPANIFSCLYRITLTGFPSFFVDIAMGIMTVLFNRQIMNYFDTNALAIYSVIISVSTFVQVCAYSIGQASQPILSMNFGAKQYGRVREALKYAIITCICLGIFWAGFSMIFPNSYIRLFIGNDAAILDTAPLVIRLYAISFVLLPFNIFSTYYFQALVKPGIAFIISVARGLVISGTLIMILPSIFGGYALWLAMPVTEILIAITAACAMLKFQLR